MPIMFIPRVLLYNNINGYTNEADYVCSPLHLYLWSITLLLLDNSLLGLRTFR